MNGSLLRLHDTHYRLMFTNGHLLKPNHQTDGPDAKGLNHSTLNLLQDKITTLEFVVGISKLVVARVIIEDQKVAQFIFLAIYHDPLEMMIK